MTAAVDILAIAAHPDDAEIGCGGALLLAADAGLTVGVADLTAGEMSTRGTSAERHEERERAAGLLGLSQRVSLGLPDSRLGSEPSHREDIAKLIRLLRPGIVLAPHPHDRHPDHEAAGRLVREACFLAGVEKAGQGAPHRPRRLYEYMIHHAFEPSFVVDVTAVWERRAKAVAAYASQFGAGEGPKTEIGNAQFLRRLEERAGYFGAMIGVERGEPFVCRGPLGFAALPDLKVAGTSGYRMYV